MMTGLTMGAAMFLLDAAAFALCWPTAVAVAGLPLSGNGDVALALAMPACALVVFFAVGLYRRDVLMDTRVALARMPLGLVLGVAAGCGAGVLLDLAAGPVAAVPAAVAALPAFGLAGIAARIAFHALKGRGLLRRRLLVVGAGRRAWDLLWILRREGRSPAYDVALLHDPELGTLDPRLLEDPANRIVPAPLRDVLAAARRIGADEIVVAPDERRGMKLEPLIACKTAGYPVIQYLSFLEKEARRVDIKRIELGWLVFSDGFTFRLIDRALKRSLDVVVSLLLLACFTPFLLAAAIAIRLDDGGPVLYRQQRVTRDGRLFRITKLRTMRVDAEANGAVWAASGDDRTTRVGRFLRRSRIDEMPQIIDVLRGDMSLVGPRPERPAFVRQLAAQLPLYNERHMVKAGLTGWAQINYPYGASTDDARSKLSYDLYYVKNFSILFDLLILLQTLRVVLFPSGAR